MLTAATGLTKQAKHTTAATPARGNARQRPNSRCYKAVYYSFTAQLNSNFTENKPCLYYKDQSDNAFEEVITTYCDSRANYVNIPCAKKSYRALILNDVLKIFSIVVELQVCSANLYRVP
jgi:hypothetical protein